MTNNVQTKAKEQLTNEEIAEKYNNGRKVKYKKLLCIFILVIIVKKH